MSAVAQLHPEQARPALSFDAWRTASRSAYEQGGFPGRSDEAWKYTSLDQISEEQRANVTSAHPVWVELPQTDHYRLVVVDGHPALSLSDVPETGVTCYATTQPNDALEAATFLRSNEPGHIALNNASTPHIIHIHIAKDTTLDKPLECLYLHTDQAEARSIYTQSWLHLEAGASLTLIESFSSDGEAASYHHHITRTELADSARLTHYRVQDTSLKHTHLYSLDLHQRAHSHYEALHLTTGAALSRMEVLAHLSEAGAHCDQRGIVIGAATQHHDCYLPVWHNAPHCYSNQHFRQMLGGRSKGIFYGTVKVPQQSIKTQAHQLNRNILLSDQAQAYSRPELDILTDDVMCSHGSTTGALDAQALHYLQTRGIGADEARRLLINASIAELLEPLEALPELQARAEEQVSRAIAAASKPQERA